MDAPAHDADPVVVRCLDCRAAVDRTLADACPFCGRDVSAMPRIQADAPEPESRPDPVSDDARVPHSPRVARFLAAVALLVAVLAPDVSRHRVLGTGGTPTRLEPSTSSSARRGRSVIDRVSLASVRRRSVSGGVRLPQAVVGPVVARPPSPERVSENRRRPQGGRPAEPPQAGPPRSDPPPPPRDDPPSPPDDPPTAEDPPDDNPPHGRGHGNGPGDDHGDNGRGNEHRRDRD